jgi:hypothetical protein
MVKENGVKVNIVKKLLKIFLEKQNVDKKKLSDNIVKEK